MRVQELKQRRRPSGRSLASCSPVQWRFCNHARSILPRENHVVQHRERIKFHRAAAFGETLLSFAQADFDPAGDLVGISGIGDQVREPSESPLPLPGSFRNS